MEEITLYHGSPRIVQRPQYGLGNLRNDYGRGFYCTEDLDLAKEWAVGKMGHPGFANEYRLDTRGLAIFDLDQAEGGVLSWIATLMANRKVSYSNLVNPHDVQAFIKAYAVDFSGADVVCGYRADDSYFDIARYFVMGTIDVNSLEAALRLGGLGRQVVVTSPKGFEALRFVGVQAVDPGEWYKRRQERNNRANMAFFNNAREGKGHLGPHFFDIVRGLS